MLFKILLLVCLTNVAQAEISINNEQLPINSGLYDISQDLGQTVGGNLFHTFDSFNLEQGEIAQFSGSNSIQNIISRVIGGEQSFINGTIRSTIPNANFYFLNPYGIVFGEHAQLDLQGSFHASTADYLKLSDNGEFHARFPQQDILTAAPIESFGFLTENPANISVENSQFNIVPTQAFSLTAGNISIANAQINAPAGHIYLATFGEIGEFSNFIPSVLQGNINISQQSLLETSGESGGGISIRSGQFILDNSQLIAQTLGAQNAETIDIAAQNITLQQDSQIDASVTGLGNGADIRLQATDSIRAIDANSTNLISIYTDAGLNQEQELQKNQTGNAGSIALNAKDIEFTGDSSITTETYSTGNAADIHINATQNITFLGSGTNTTSGSVSSRTYNTSENAGKAGNIFLTAEHILLQDEYSLNASGYGVSDAGNISLNADNMNINSTLITNMTFAAGDAGLIMFDIKDTLSLYGTRIFNLSMGSGNANTTQVKARNIYFDYGSYFLSLNRRMGNAGDINMEVTDTIYMAGARNGYAAQIASISSPTIEGVIAGDAGNVNIKAGRLIMRDGANIGSSSFSRLGYYAGAGGNIDINVQGEIDIQGVNPFGESEDGFASGIYARSWGVGDTGSQSGNIRLQAKSLKLTDGAAITSSTNNYAPSGTIDIFVQDSIEIRGDASHIALREPGEQQIDYLKNYSVIDLNQSTSGIYARSLDNNVKSGAAGNIHITTHSLDMSDKGRISTSSAGGGQAGNIKLTLEQLTVDSTAKIASESQFVNRYQFANVDERDNALIKQGDIIKATDLGNGKLNYYVNIGTHLIPSRVPIKPVTSVEELYQLSEQYLLTNGQVVDVINEEENLSGQYIYTHHHGLEIDTWQRMDQHVTTILETLQPILAVRKDNNGYFPGEALPDYHLGERIRVLDVGNGKPAEFIYTNMLEDSGSRHVDFVQVNQFNLTDLEALNALPEQMDFDGEYPVATVENPQQGLVGQFIYADNQWVALNDQRQIAQITDVNTLTLAKAGNIAEMNDTDMIYTGQKWIDLNLQQTVNTIADLEQLNAQNGDLVKVIGDNNPVHYFYTDGQWIQQEQGGNAGMIEIQANTVQVMNNGTITTEAISAGGGGISLNVDNVLYLNNGRISASVQEGAGNGGNLTVNNSQFLIMNNAQLVAQAYEGQGGNIRIAAAQFIKDPISLVSASSQLGIDGNIETTSPDETISNGLLSLNNHFATPAQIKDACKAVIAGQMPTEFQLPLTFKVNMYRSMNDFIGDRILSFTPNALTCRQ